MANKQDNSQASVRLENIRKKVQGKGFPIRKFREKNSYLSSVYYMGSKKMNNKGIMPIKCSMAAIEELEKIIDQWILENNK